MPEMMKVRRETSVKTVEINARTPFTLKTYNRLYFYKMAKEVLWLLINYADGTGPGITSLSSRRNREIVFICTYVQQKYVQFKNNCKSETIEIVQLCARMLSVQMGGQQQKCTIAEA
uniref:Uncharacterized protein n=1 Tax=Glossina pallidipes TaxID=7398 RepID=A0A1A9ZEJ0_GLOPL